MKYFSPPPPHHNPHLIIIFISCLISILFRTVLWSWTTPSSVSQREWKHEKMIILQSWKKLGMRVIKVFPLLSCCRFLWNDAMIMKEGEWCFFCGFFLTTINETRMRIDEVFFSVFPASSSYMMSSQSNLEICGHKMMVRRLTTHWMVVSKWLTAD